MDEKGYNKKLWAYAVMVVLAAVLSVGSPLLSTFITNSVVSWVLGIISMVLFIFATVWFGVAINLKSRQWAAAILLLLLAGAASVIYMVSRKPNPATG